MEVLSSRVLFKYLIVKLKMLACSLLFALDHSEFSFWREFLRMSDIMKRCDFN